MWARYKQGAISVRLEGGSSYWWAHAKRNWPACCSLPPSCYKIKPNWITWPRKKPSGVTRDNTGVGGEHIRGMWHQRSLDWHPLLQTKLPIITGYEATSLRRSRYMVGHMVGWARPSATSTCYPPDSNPSSNIAIAFILSYTRPSCGFKGHAGRLRSHHHNALCNTRSHYSGHQKHCTVYLVGIMLYMLH